MCIKERHRKEPGLHGYIGFGQRRNPVRENKKLENNDENQRDLKEASFIDTEEIDCYNNFAVRLDKRIDIAYYNIGDHEKIQWHDVEGNKFTLV